jgi:hypothetical protein
MHTGEEFFSWSWPQYALIAGIFVSFLLLSVLGRLPAMSAFKEFADTINSAGGHIILLTLLSMWSIKIAMQFFYHLLGLAPERFDKASSIVTAGITFVQGGLCGTFIGALIKTMSGGKANGPENGTAPPRSSVFKLPDPPGPLITNAVAPPVNAQGVTMATAEASATKPIGFVGDRGDKGDLGTNNSTGGTQ